MITNNPRNHQLLLNRKSKMKVAVNRDSIINQKKRSNRNHYIIEETR